MVLLTLGALTYGGFYFGSKTKDVSKPQAGATESTQNIITNIVTPKPTVSSQQLTTVSAGVPKSAGLSFDQYSITFPENWKLEKTNQTMMDQKLTLSSNNYEINIFQGATGGALCLYAGDSEFEGPSSKYETFVELTTKDNRLLRRSGDKNGIAFTICQKSGDGSFQQPTNYGHISVEMPADFTPEILSEIDSIISSLKKI